MVVRVPTTSLACNSEADVGITIVRPRSCRRHLPCIQQRDGGGFRPRLCHHHLPRVQQRDGGGFRPRSCRPHLPSEEEGEVASGKVASLSYELVCTQDEVARSHVTAPPPTSLVKRHVTANRPPALSNASMPRHPPASATHSSCLETLPTPGLNSVTRMSLGAVPPPSVIQLATRHSGVDVFGCGRRHLLTLDLQSCWVQ